MQSLTDFGDQAVVLPLFVLAALAFIATGWRRAALVWLLVVPATLLIVSLGKLYGFGCENDVPNSWGLHSPSGHTASAALIGGGLALLLLPVRRRMVTVLSFAAASAIVIGGSRLSLQLHSSAEVLVGAAIGIAGTWILVWQAGERPAQSRHLPLTAAILLCGAVVFHGTHIPVETWISESARSIWPAVLCGTGI
jgi:membrane-associated phospholipid phosphatase